LVGKRNHSILSVSKSIAKLNIVPNVYSCKYLIVVSAG
jgi:hypothetical protein